MADASRDEQLAQFQVSLDHIFCCCRSLSFYFSPSLDVIQRELSFTLSPPTGSLTLPWPHFMKETGTWT